MAKLTPFTILLQISCLFLQGNCLANRGGAFIVHKDIRSNIVLRGGSSSEYVPELKPPPAMFNGAVAAGSAKANLPALKILLLGILGGCHIAFGAFLVLSVGGNIPDIA
eukprot:gene45448-60720_t